MIGFYSLMGIGIDYYIGFMGLCGWNDNMVYEE